MKILRGVNPDFADFDEIDVDVEDALNDWNEGIISFEELSRLVGPETAENLRRIRYEETGDEAALFDDPDDFDVD